MRVNARGGAPTHVRSWPLRPTGAQYGRIGTRFFTGVRVYNAVLGGFIGRSRAVKADPAWRAARELPRRTAAERQRRGAAFGAVQTAHGFTADAAQSFASSLRKSWVREHLPAQETQNLGVRAFDAVRQWHVGKKGKPGFKNARRGLHSVAAKDGNGALRPNTDDVGRLVGLQWGAGFVAPIAAPAVSGRRGREQQAELAEIEALIAAGKVLSCRIVRAVINGSDTYRMQLVCDGRPTRRHPVGDGRVSFDLGPSQIAVAEHRKCLHGALGNRLLGHGTKIACERLEYVSWQKNFPRSVRDRAPGLLVEVMRRKAESAGGQQLYEYSPRTTALSQTCLCGNRKKKPLSQRVHRCACGITEDRDLFSACLGLHVRTGVDGVDRLDLPSARQGWGHRHDVDESPKSSRSASARKRRGRRHPPSRRSVARIKARRAARATMRQSRSAQTSTTDQPTAIAA